MVATTGVPPLKAGNPILNSSACSGLSAEKRLPVIPKKLRSRQNSPNAATKMPLDVQDNDGTR
jgi:hypothetical protein